MHGEDESGGDAGGEEAKGEGEAGEEVKASDETQAPKPKKKKKNEGIITVYRLVRGGKKCICQITGFEYYTKDLKAMAKNFGKKFSCGSNIAQDDIYGECISV